MGYKTIQYPANRSGQLEQSLAQNTKNDANAQLHNCTVFMPNYFIFKYIQLIFMSAINKAHLKHY